MQVQMKVAPQVIVTAEGDNHIELFDQLASLQEVFSNDKCGKCGSTALKFVSRQDKEENDYHELQCTKCWAKLAFGHHKKGKSLFPKRKDDDKGTVTGEPNGWLPTNGWLKWNKDKNILE